MLRDRKISERSCKGGGVGGALAPDGAVETSWSKPETLSDVLQEQVAFDLPFESHF